MVSSRNIVNLRFIVNLRIVNVRSDCISLSFSLYRTIYRLDSVAKFCLCWSTTCCGVLRTCATWSPAGCGSSSPPTSRRGATAATVAAGHPRRKRLVMKRGLIIRRERKEWKLPAPFQNVRLLPIARALSPTWIRTPSRPCWEYWSTCATRRRRRRRRTPPTEEPRPSSLLGTRTSGFAA